MGSSGPSVGVSRATTGATGTSQEQIADKAEKAPLGTPSAAAARAAASRNWPSGGIGIGGAGAPTWVKKHASSHMVDKPSTSTHE